MHTSDAMLEAATLAFALIRFAEGAAYPARGHVPPGVPRVGEDFYVFTPARRIPRDKVPTFLAALPAPALIHPTTTRGIIALHLLSELSAERAAEMQQHLDNYRAGLEHLVAQLSLTPVSNILLEFGDERHTVTLDTLSLSWSRFGVDIGWSITSLDSTGIASGRLNLFRSDGVNSHGAPGPPHCDTAV